LAGHLRRYLVQVPGSVSTIGRGPGWRRAGQQLLVKPMKYGEIEQVGLASGLGDHLGPVGAPASAQHGLLA